MTEDTRATMAGNRRSKMANKRDWSGFKWESNGGQMEIICQNPDTGLWSFLFYVNGVGVAGGEVGESYMRYIETWLAHSAAAPRAD